MTPPVITRRQLNRALLARQLLLERSEMTTEEAIAHLVGLQAQAPNPPYIGLWARLAGFDFDDLSALVRHHRVVRLALMRSTIHLVTAEDAVAIRGLLQPMLARAFHSSGFAKHVVGLDLAAVASAGCAALEARPSTFSELGAVLGQQWPDRDPAALAQVVRALVALVQVPPRGIWGESGAARHAPLATWVPGDATGPLRADDLVVRYLGAFGPAAVADFQAWSGMTRTGEIFDDLRPRLTTFRDEAGVELFDLPDAPRPHADTPSPVRFIAEYDNILVSHADRRRVISDDDRKRMASANGVVPGTVLVDGFVAGLWKVTGDRRQATLTVTTLRTLPKGHAGAVRDEGRRLLAVAAATAPSSQVVVDPG